MADGRPGLPETPEAFLALHPGAALGVVQEFMAARYSEGYTKGVHDEDALRILSALRRSHLALRRARFSPAARACAAVWWTRFCPEGTRKTWRLKRCNCRRGRASSCCTPAPSGSPWCGPAMPASPTG
jgi:hypothetical protein